MSNKAFSLHQLEVFIHKRLISTHFINDLYYGAKVVNDIMYNKKSRIVATFKNYLILDDLSEFLKRFYTLSESSIRLPRYFEYYDTYSRIFPNFTALPESKYIYKNIHKKQKMIDLQQELEYSKEKKKQKKNPKKKESENKVFNTEVYNSLQNDSNYIESLFGFEFHDAKQISRLYLRTSKIINEIEDYENKLNIMNISKPSKIIGSFISSQLNGCNIINTTNSIFKNININIYNEIQLANNTITPGMHRKTLSSNNSKTKNYYNNINNVLFNKVSKHKISIAHQETEKIKVNMNMNMNINNLSKDKKQKDSYTHLRNHNCLLNKKGQIFNSQTLHTLKLNFTNKIQKRVNTNMYNIEKNKFQSKVGGKTTRLKTERQKSTFEFELLHNLIQKKHLIRHIKVPSTAILNTVKNSSKTKKKFEDKLNNNKFLKNKYNSNNISLSITKKISANVTRSGNSSRAISKVNSKPQINNGRVNENVNNKSDKEAIKVKTSNKKSGIIFVSSPKRSAIKGIHIKNFNKIKTLNQYFSPQTSNDSKRKIRKYPLTSRTIGKTLMK